MAIRKRKIGLFQRVEFFPSGEKHNQKGEKTKNIYADHFSLIQAADFADRWENQFLPMLKAGVIVLADRYAFTGFARDVVRGVDRKWVRNLYSFALSA